MSTYLNCVDQLGGIDSRAFVSTPSGSAWLATSSLRDWLCLTRHFQIIISQKERLLTINGFQLINRLLIQ